MQAVGDDLVDSIVGDNIPILTEAEKFNETVISSVKRVSARLLGARCAAACVLRVPPASQLPDTPVWGTRGCHMLTPMWMPSWTVACRGTVRLHWPRHAVPCRHAKLGLWWLSGGGYLTCCSSGHCNGRRMLRLTCIARAPSLVGSVCARAGQADPGPPERADTSRKRTYKTKQETDKTRNVTGTIVLTLLGISVIVPMLQYWGAPRWARIRN